ncbi:MAG: hypothetical protein H7321_01825 [Bacteroidia bacterium]|nr:hypothetical protein [Bacteroidia bacterium]
MAQLFISAFLFHKDLLEMPAARNKHIPVLLILMTLLCLQISAQNESPLRLKTFRFGKDTVKLDSLPVIIGSVKIYSNGVLQKEGKDFVISHSRSSLIPLASLFDSSVTVYYRVVQFKMTLLHRHKSIWLIEPELNDNYKYYNYNLNNPDQNGSLFQNSGLNVDGNISRGIGVGNNQDVVLNSNLNLRLSGKLGKEIDVLAAISDENNPIQPEGNTQQLQDFDKVFITLSKDSSMLTVGDFLMQRPSGSYFMNYYKKSRGLQLAHMGKLGKYGKHYSQAEAAVSRGRFARNEIQGQEANQGPYRLSGANNETYIILISGTESVYLDGEKLTRGQQFDYTIDYNTGQIVFMPKRLINRYSRIIVEFQYSDRNYARSVAHAGEKFDLGKTKIRVNYYTEQDNKAQPTDTSNLSSVQTILENAGDKDAFITNEIRFNTFQSDRVMYRKTDSLGFSYYVQTDNAASDSFFYAVSFSYVGEGMGNYINVASATNGKVYRFVFPVAGVPQGNYEPITKLVSPKRMQMLTVGIDMQATKTTLVNAEIAGTDYDKNTYSLLDKNDDNGLAATLNITDKQKLKRNNLITLTNTVNAEYTSADFKYIERYRNVEFERSWNRTLSNPSAQRPPLTENILGYKTSLVHEKYYSLNYAFGYYTKGEVFKGSRHSVLAQGNYKNYTLSLAAELQQTGEKQTINFKNKYSKYIAGITRTIEDRTAGLIYTQEQSVFKADTNSGLGSSSYSYRQVKAFMQRQGLRRFKYQTEAFYRLDFLPVIEKLTEASQSVNFSLTLQQQGKRPSNNLLFTLSARDYQARTAAAQLPERTVLSRIEYQVTALKQVVSSNTYYQVGTGREQKLQYSYALVSAGNGVYAWNDYNENGVEELNEFEISAFRDQAKYIRVYLPTNEFIRSNTNEFNQSVRLQSPLTWQQKKGVRKVLSKFNVITSLKVDRKTTDNSLQTLLNPLKLNINDSALISVNSLIKHTTFFNRANPYFGVEHNIQTVKGKTYLTGGFDTRENRKQNAVVRIGFSKSWSMNTNVEAGNKGLFSEYFTSRNYSYNYRMFNPELFYQGKKDIRTGVFYKYFEGINKPEYGGERAYNHEAGAQIRYFVVSKGSLDLKFSRIKVNYKGSSLSPVAYDMLNGLQNGTNLVWNVSVGTRISKNIQFNLTYDGRKSEISKAIHTGRVEARYVF